MKFLMELRHKQVNKYSETSFHYHYVWHVPIGHEPDDACCTPRTAGIVYCRSVRPGIERIRKNVKARWEQGELDQGGTYWVIPQTMDLMEEKCEQTQNTPLSSRS